MPLTLVNNKVTSWAVHKIAVVGPGIVGMPMAAMLAHARIMEGSSKPARVVVIQRNSVTSGWKVNATNFEGPAPRPLERFKLTIGDDGGIIVDKGVAFRIDKGDADKPGAFLPFA